jgi:hypothetical protein
MAAGTELCGRWTRQGRCSDDTRRGIESSRDSGMAGRRRLFGGQPNGCIEAVVMQPRRTVANVKFHSARARGDSGGQSGIHERDPFGGGSGMPRFQ